jgi:hypothetical protein
MGMCLWLQTSPHIHDARSLIPAWAEAKSTTLAALQRTTHTGSTSPPIGQMVMVYKNTLQHVGYF